MIYMIYIESILLIYACDVSQVTDLAELLCPICKELLSDAVMMPCCAGSACDDCARTGIVESEGCKCPMCGDMANPEELIPYRMYREKVGLAHSPYLKYSLLTNYCLFVTG